MNKLTVKQAIEQGYTQYVYGSEGFQKLRDLGDFEDVDITQKDIFLIEKEPYHPSGMDAKDIADILAEQIQSNHSDDCGDDTESVYEAINAMDFTDVEKRISEVLSKLNYYRATDIKLDV